MIAIGTDHGGFELKEYILKYFDENGIKYKDFGPYSYEALDDYPPYVEKVCRAIQRGECDKGIVICGNGVGVSVAANKFRGIRAGLCGDTYTARTAKQHGNINILALGERVIGKGLALEIINIWLNSEFLGGKYQARLDMVSAFEDEE